MDALTKKKIEILRELFQKKVEEFRLEQNNIFSSIQKDIDKFKIGKTRSKINK